MVTVLAIVGVLAVLFAAAVLATREGPVLADAPRDAPDLDLPPGPLSADDVSEVRFDLALRGYRMSEVDEVLERVAGDLRARDERIAALEEALRQRAAPGGSDRPGAGASSARVQSPPPGASSARLQSPPAGASSAPARSAPAVGSPASAEPPASVEGPGRAQSAASVQAPAPGTVPSLRESDR